MAVTVTVGNVPAWSSRGRKLRLPTAWKDKNMAMRKQQSPMRVVTNAFFPATAALFRLNQNDTSR